MLAASWLLALGTIGGFAAARRLPPAALGPARPEVGTAGVFAVGGSPYSVVVADLDGVQPPEIATANLKGESVTVLVGGPHPSSRIDWGVGGMAIALTAPDVDGDGRPELAVAVQSRALGRPIPALGHVALIRDPTDASTRRRARCTSVRGTPTHIASADLDGDRADEVLVALSEGAVLILGRDRRGGLALRGRFGIPGCDAAGGHGPDGLWVSDFDGDGAADVAVACYDGWSIHVARGDGHGRFSTPRVVARIEPGTVLRAIHRMGKDPVEMGTVGGLRKVTASDLDRDGRAELIAVGDWGLLLVVPGDRRPPHVLDTGVDGTNSLVIVPVRSGRAAEVLVLTGMDPYGIRVPADDLLTREIRVARLGPFPDTPEALSLADLDADGELDLVVAGEHASAVQLLRGDGSGGFAPFLAAPRAGARDPA